MSNEIKQGQSFLDKTLEQTGTLTNAVAMAEVNDVSLTDNLEIGTKIIVAGAVSKSMVSVLSGAAPATASAAVAASLSPIDYLLPQIFPIQ